MERVKITFWLKNKMCILDPRTSFDAIFAGNLFKRLVHVEGFPALQAIEHCTKDLPFKKIFISDEEFFYATSLPELNHFCVDRHVYVRKHEYHRFRSYLGKENTIRIVRNRGISPTGNTPYIPAVYGYSVFLTETVSFIAEVDTIVMKEKYGTDDIEELMREIVIAIGAKPSLGYGVVETVSVEPASGREIERYVPLAWAEQTGVKPKYPIFLSRILPPYWLQEGRQLCCLARI